MTIEELRGQQAAFVKQKKKEAKKIFVIRLLMMLPFLLLLAAVLLVALQMQENRHFEVTYYGLESKKVGTPVKFVVLSDLHSQEYGNENTELVEAIRKEEPDFIAMIGDMVNLDDTNFSVIRRLCKNLREIAPVYYTLGNHEGTVMYGRLDTVALDELLEEDGVTMLINQTTVFQKEDTKIQIAGIAIDVNGYDQFAKERMEDFWELEDYKIVLSHFPSLYYSKLKDAKMDLALAGHYHGGVVRIPGMEGLYHPEGGFFPKYSGGQYSLTNATLIVSRGIGGHDVIPRINNRPELVVIEIR